MAHGLARGLYSLGAESPPGHLIRHSASNSIVNSGSPTHPIANPSDGNLADTAVQSVPIARPVPRQEEF